MWKDNKRHGRGRHYYHKGKAMYNGLWESDKRAGKGSYSLLDPKTKEYRTIYYGEWRDDMKDGNGIFYYAHDVESYYEGNWSCDKRHGFGKMFFPDGSIYEGGWVDDQEHGRGTLYLSNGDVYDGQWEHGVKHGQGNFHLRSRGHVLVGTWFQGTSKCGEIKSVNDSSADNPFEYDIPELKLADPTGVLAEARTHLKKKEQN